MLKVWVKPRCERVRTLHLHAPRGVFFMLDAIELFMWREPPFMLVQQAFHQRLEHDATLSVGRFAGLNEALAVQA